MAAGIFNSGTLKINGTEVLCTSWNCQMVKNVPDSTITSAQNIVTGIKTIEGTLEVEWPDIKVQPGDGVYLDLDGTTLHAVITEVLYIANVNSSQFDVMTVKFQASGEQQKDQLRDLSQLIAEVLDD